MTEKFGGKEIRLDVCLAFFSIWGWSGGAKVLGKLPVPGRPTILITLGQGPIALAVGAGGGCLDIFTLIYPFSSLSPSLWETARYRLKYCLKGPLNPNQPTNQPTNQPNSSPFSVKTSHFTVPISYFLSHISNFRFNSFPIYLPSQPFYQYSTHQISVSTTK